MDKAKAVYFVVVIIVARRTPIQRVRTPGNHPKRHLGTRIGVARARHRANEWIHIVRQISGWGFAETTANPDKVSYVFRFHVLFEKEIVSGFSGNCSNALIQFSSS
jgi:hypothetical protein